MKPIPPLALDRLEVSAWCDPRIDDLGIDVHSDYVEKYWLGILGPSSTWLLRYLVAELDAARGSFIMEPHLASACLGLGMARGQNSSFMRALGRLIQHNLVRGNGYHGIAVRRYVPLLSQRHVQRLPHLIQRDHLFDSEDFQQSTWYQPEPDPAA